jgi:hypothetical protein
VVVLPDIEAGRLIAEQAMVDQCRILRDSAGPRDDVLNRTTGRIAPPAGDETTVYEGICGPTVETPLDARREEGGRTAHYRAWRTRIPMSAPLPVRNDVVLILECERDPTLVGRRLRITDVNQSSIGVTRRLALEDETAPTVE